MLSLLTKYLLRYKQVSIPSIGSFSIAQEPARFDFGAKLIFPPSSHTEFHHQQEVPDLQYLFLSKELNIEKEEAYNKLHSFGNHLRELLQQNPFHWNGLGTLELTGKQIDFRSLPHQWLQPVAAEKVIREHATHVIRRGEDEVHSSFQLTTEKKPAKRQSFLWIAWLLVLLAALFILFLLYKEKFSVHASSLQSKFGLW